MTTTVSTDASNRAWRTFLQGLLVDVIAAVVLVVGPALAGTDFAWSKTYWVTVAGLAGRSVLMAAVSYVARKVVPPPGVVPAPYKPPTTWTDRGEL